MEICLSGDFSKVSAITLEGNELLVRSTYPARDRRGSRPGLFCRPWRRGVGSSLPCHQRRVAAPGPGSGLWETRRNSDEHPGDSVEAWWEWERERERERGVGSKKIKEWLDGKRVTTGREMDGEKNKNRERWINDEENERELKISVINMIMKTISCLKS